MQPIRLLLSLTGIILLIILAIWIFTSSWVFGQDDGLIMAGNVGILDLSERIPDTISAEIERGRMIIADQNSQYRSLSWLSELGMWLSFAATAVITLMTGAFNFPNPDTATSKSKVGRFHFLGFIAALASICTLLAAQTGSMAEQRLNAAEEIEDILSEVAIEIRANPEREQELLVRLETILGKYE